MGFFNLVETFFFISLAITFVLIMMLVYHFKDRLTTLETKSETILEIINNLLKENSVLKSGYLQIIQSIQNTRSPPEKEQPAYNRIIVSEDDEDDVDEYDSDDYESDEDSEEHTEEPVIKQIQIHGGFNANIHDIADIDELDGIDNIDNLDFERTSNELDDLEVDITEKESEVEEVLEVDNSEPEIGVEEIIVTKLEDIMDDNLRESSESKTISENNFIQPVEVYRKMEIGELRSLVIQKGLATDTKKLKKMDLIRLLTSNSSD